MKYNLIVAEPGKEPVPYELNAERIGLGRGPENQIHVPSEFVSHTHVEFHRVDTGIEIVDLGSKNGTRVNGQPVSGNQLLRDGDRILIGECVAAHLLLLPDDAAPVEAAPKGDAATHKAAATYTSLDKKLQDLETDIESKQSEAEALSDKINELSTQFETRKKEFAGLEASVVEMKDQLESKREAAGENAPQEVAAEIASIERDILKQTQKITVLKSDLDKREAEISELQLTAKVTVATPDDADGAVDGGTPVAPPSPTPVPSPAPSSSQPVAAKPPTATPAPAIPAPPASAAAPAAPRPAAPSAPAKPGATPTVKLSKLQPKAPKKPLPIPKKPGQ